MKIRHFFFLLIICALTLTVSAQDDDAAHYKLRKLTAEQYLDGIIQIVPPDGNYDNFYFPQTANDVIINSYHQFENEPWEKLLGVYNRLWVGQPDKNFSYNRGEWNRAIIQAWLRDNQTDLSEYQQVQFADYDIHVSPRDFNNDGKNEYILDVVKSATRKLDRKDCDYAAEYVDYLVVQGDKGNYQVSRPSMTWFSSLGGGPFWRDFGGAVELRFEDINADGLPEWIIAEGGEIGGGPGMGYSRAGELYIYAWREGKLKKLTPEYRTAKNSDETFVYYEADGGGGCPTLSNTITWDFTNVDDDPALEILEHQSYVDNWSCESVVTKRFDWDRDKDLYTYTSIDKKFADTQNCVQRQAEEAMWAGDYQKAIPLFEKALTLPQYKVVPTATQWQQQLAEIKQYLRARLALAYVMTNQPEKAKPFLAALRLETFTENATQQFVNAIVQYQDNPFKTCIWAYYTFTQIYPRNMYGFADDDVAPDSRPYLPEKIGCNAPKMVVGTFDQHTFHTNQSLTKQILGLGLNSQRYLKFDLNNDGQDEWLIWLQIPLPPFFFVPDGDIYHVEQVDINPYLYRGEITTWGLPDGAGKAVIFKTAGDYQVLDDPPWFGAYYGMDGYGGPTTNCVSNDNLTPNFTRYQMWRMEGHILEPILDAALCPSAVKDLFPQGEGSPNLDGGRIKNDDGYAPVTFEDLKYVWDSNEKIFKRVEIPKTPTPVVTSIPEPESKYYSALMAFEQSDFEALIEMTEQISLAEYSNQYNADAAIQNLTRDTYLRALALQHLGRDHEAIEAFLKMIDVAPDEQWKKLAMLYLEPI